LTDAEATKSLRAGVAGAGHLGTWHARKYAELADVELVAVYDVDGDKAAQLAAELDCRVAVDEADLYSSVDVLSVAVPTVAHEQVGVAALQAGVHLLMEKPLAHDLESGRRIAAAATAAERVLQVGHLERFNPVFRSLKETVDEARFIECHRLSPFAGRGTDVDVVRDVMIHDLDLVEYLVGKPVVSIEGIGVPVLSDTIDIANVRLRFEGGCVANMTASRVSLKKERKMRVFQEDAYVSIDFDSGRVMVARRGSEPRDPARPMSGIEAEETLLSNGDPLKTQVQAFLDCVRTGSKPVVDGEQGLRALELAERVVQALEVPGDLG